MGGLEGEDDVLDDLRRHLCQELGFAHLDGTTPQNDVVAEHGLQAGDFVEEGPDFLSFGFWQVDAAALELGLE